jgi:hypothetical protein
MSKPGICWRLSRGVRLKWRTALALVLMAGAVSACAAQLASLPGIGEPAGVPERPATPAEFPAVHDMPPPRDTPPLTAAERAKIEADLTGARDRQEAEAAAEAEVAKKKAEAVAAEAAAKQRAAAAEEAAKKKAEAAAKKKATKTATRDKKSPPGKEPAPAGPGTKTEGSREP